MEWARDIFGNDVHASEGGLNSFSLKCPICKGPVFWRRSKLSYPHFVHNGFRGKPECELYHPSHNTGSNVVTHPSPAGNTGTALHDGGIFLELRDKNRYCLHVKLPQLPIGTDAAGEIIIRTHFSEDSYNSLRLQRPCTVKVSAPRRPLLLEIVSTEELSEVGKIISNLVNSFRESNNYFKAGESWRKLLWPKEPLEWGEQYHLLSKHELSQTLKDYGVHFECKSEKNGWYLYDIDLPKITRSRSEQWKETVQRSLGREIRIPRPKVYFVAPPPHHIEPDGTYVFQDGTERIIIQNTWNSSISIKYGQDIDCQALVDSRMEGHTEITNIKTGNFSILVNGHEALLGRVEDCPLFQPDGVTVTTSNGSIYEIFQSGLADILLHETVDSISCPNQRVADNLDLSIDYWSQVGSTFIPIPLREKWQEVDAGNFGFLVLPTSSEASEPDVVAIDARLNAKRKWLEGIVVRLYGPKMLNQLCNQWDSPFQTNLCSELACLWPHIVSAQSR